MYFRASVGRKRKDIRYRSPRTIHQPIINSLEFRNGAKPFWQNLVGLTRFELVTPRLSSVCSNQLSYRPSSVYSSPLHVRQRHDDNRDDTTLAKLLSKNPTSPRLRRANRLAGRSVPARRPVLSKLDRRACQQTVLPLREPKLARVEVRVRSIF